MHIKFLLTGNKNKSHYDRQCGNVIKLKQRSAKTNLSYTVGKKLTIFLLLSSPNAGRKTMITVRTESDIETLSMYHLTNF